MRPPLVIASVLCGLLISQTAQCEVHPSAATGKPKRLEIQVDEHGWGAVSSSDIETVLYSVANLLLARMPAKAPITIRVSHTDGNPAAVYDRGPSGEFLVRLHADRSRWHLYVFEFAHEFCHILSNYDRAGPDVARRNQWLEEALCETASLYALGSLGAQPPDASLDPRLAEHAASLRHFFRVLVTEGHRKLPEESELAEWLQEREDGMRDDPYLREENDLVAEAMLPLFFANPNGWDALCYMNLHPDDAFASLDDFLRHWYANAPERDRPFVAKLSGLLAGSAAIYDQAPTAVADISAANGR